MSLAMEIRALIDTMEDTRRELAEKLQQIASDTDHSDTYKARKRAEAIEDAKKELQWVHEQVERRIPALEALAVKQKSFSYTDPKLLSAIDFVQRNPGAVPEPAWQAMIADFTGRPAELFYLSDLFSKNGVVAAAIAAKEAANTVAISSGLPQRVADKVFYMTSTDPSAHVDASSLMGDLDALERYESQGAEAE